MAYAKELLESNELAATWPIDSLSHQSTVEQQKLEPALQDYLKFLADNHPFALNMRFQRHRIAHPLSDMLKQLAPVTTPRMIEGARFLVRRIEAGALSLAHVGESPDIQMHLKVVSRDGPVTSWSAPHLLPQPNQAALLQAYDGQHGLEKNYDVPASEELPSFDHMAVEYGLIAVMQLVSPMFNNANDMRKMGMGVGVNLWSEPTNRDDIVKPKEGEAGDEHLITLPPGVMHGPGTSEAPAPTQMTKQSMTIGELERADERHPVNPIVIASVLGVATLPSEDYLREMRYERFKYQQQKHEQARHMLQAPGLVLAYEMQKHAATHAQEEVKLDRARYPGAVALPEQVLAETRLPTAQYAQGRYSDAAKYAEGKYAELNQVGETSGAADASAAAVQASYAVTTLPVARYATATAPVVVHYASTQEATIPGVPTAGEASVEPSRPGGEAVETPAETSGGSTSSAAAAPSSVEGATSDQPAANNTGASGATDEPTSSQPALQSSQTSEASGQSAPQPEPEPIVEIKGRYDELKEQLGEPGEPIGGGSAGTEEIGHMLAEDEEGAEVTAAEEDVAVEGSVAEDAVAEDAAVEDVVVGENVERVTAEEVIGADVISDQDAAEQRQEARENNQNRTQNQTSDPTNDQGPLSFENLHHLHHLHEAMHQEPQAGASAVHLDGRREEEVVAVAATTPSVGPQSVETVPQPAAAPIVDAVKMVKKKTKTAKSAKSKKKGVNNVMATDTAQPPPAPMPGPEPQ